MLAASVEPTCSGSGGQLSCTLITAVRPVPSGANCSPIHTVRQRILRARADGGHPSAERAARLANLGMLGGNGRPPVGLPRGEPDYLSKRTYSLLPRFFLQDANITGC